MQEQKLGVIEARFADMIWEKQPVSSGELAALAAQQLQWKKSTTYTVLKRLCQRGLFENDGGTVRALVSRQEFYAAQSRQYVAESFGGSLPAFLAAFTHREKLSQEELRQLQRLIDENRG